MKEEDHKTTQSEAIKKQAEEIWKIKEDISLIYKHLNGLVSRLSDRYDNF